MSHPIKADLIVIAGELVMGRYGLAIDDQKWMKSTPMGERRRIMRAIDAEDEKQKLLGLRLKELADKL